MFRKSRRQIYGCPEEKPVRVLAELKYRDPEPEPEPDPSKKETVKICSINGPDGCPLEIECHSCFDAEDEAPPKDYLGHFCAMINSSSCAPQKSTWNPIYERSYQRKTYDPRCEPCLQGTICPDGKLEKKVELGAEASPSPEATAKAPMRNMKRRPCNEFCCRPLVASRLNLTCTQSPTKGCLPSKSYTFSVASSNCPPPCPASKYQYPKIPYIPITVLMQSCKPMVGLCPEDL